MKHFTKSIIIWLLAGCLLIWGMVVVGGITRLTHSGLSMAKWKISTVMPPHTDEEWQADFNDYKQTPEFKQVNSYFTIEDYKHIYWWEFIHRLIGRMIGMVFLIPFVFFVYKGWLKGSLLWKTLIIFALGGAQGILGWYMVASGLQDVPHVSHYFLAAHLITAFITFGYSFWVALDLIYPNLEYSIQVIQYPAFESGLGFFCFLCSFRLCMGPLLQVCMLASSIQPGLKWAITGLHLK